MVTMGSPSLPYTDSIRVRFSDTDAQGHLYFANYLVYADEVAGFYMESLGLNAMNPQQAPCFIFTVNINCDYVGECKAYDNVTVGVGYTRLGTSSAELAFLLQLTDDTILARGSLTQVFVDKESRNPMPIPGSFREAIIRCQPELA
ncbi:acyl-CoA thioesterase [Kineobactrum sediminis]|uniref:Acyl-CoA thioesterase n=1 Tax=Kineobactrum sediminis TaxID=1905677 RepID=A0A2N5Y2D7_9GAMM|nr:thioesterase family protein [Kineobactrum sediminis]PLW82552.1 acyl-CoA thioesterase [Kineobactrum sediminis]